MIWNIEKPENDMDKILTYEKGSSNREKLEKEIEKIKDEPIEIPLIINGEEIRTDDTIEIRSPHDKDIVLAKAHLAGKKELKKAIDAAMKAHQEWSKINWYHRIAIFKNAASLLQGPKRFRNIAAIMMNQSKNTYEAEIDLAELVDFWNFNSYFTKQIYEGQPNQHPGETNRLDWRPLEGFILAVPPFNFYSIGGNLPTAPAMVGNTVLWKPARVVSFANYEIMKVLQQAGIPDGVINFVPFSSKNADVVLKNPDFAGLHFTGSYKTLTTIWKTVGNNITKYKNFPRIVGETGGKDFIFMHHTADVDKTVDRIIHGAFGYQGQKCSAASRAYIPKSQWEQMKKMLIEKTEKLTQGSVEDFDNFLGAVIDEDAYKKITSYIDHAKKSEEYEILVGGEYDDQKGWFVKPTIVLTDNPEGKLITEEIFGPVVTVYVYADEDYEETLELCDKSTPYGLTGSIMAQDRYAIKTAESKLRYTAGNFYINDKPTGAVVARQPFGGARHSGTNDKAGFYLNLLRWLSPRNIKETQVLPTDWE
ncbi:MAG: L-glutamate gamma-semialdehyde dehydrogenase [Candidatus Thermoplasmatota archaeon]